MHNPLDMTGKTALVTGASSGIGREIALLLSKFGCRVVLVSRNRSRLEETCRNMEGPGHDLQMFDFSDYEASPNWMKDISQSVGSLDGVVHSAGLHLASSLRMLENQVRGCALLSLTRQQNILAGKIVDCFMDSPSAELWNSAIFALTRQLGKSGSDIFSCYGSTQWMATALKVNGYSLLRTSPFSLRDPRGLIPAGASFYLTMLEADHGY